MVALASIFHPVLGVLFLYGPNLFPTSLLFPLPDMFCQILLQIWGVGVLSFWPSFWLSGSLALWFWLSGLLAFWPSGLLAFLLAFWPSDLLAFWPSGLLAFWPSGLLALWPSGLLFDGCCGRRTWFSPRTRCESPRALALSRGDRFS